VFDCAYGSSGYKEVGNIIDGLEVHADSIFRVTVKIEAGCTSESLAAMLTSILILRPKSSINIRNELPMKPKNSKYKYRTSNITIIRILSSLSQ
jgi:hypothetical protein